MFFFLFCRCPFLLFFFFFNDTATTEIYTLSLHDALPISVDLLLDGGTVDEQVQGLAHGGVGQEGRSEEHTSELQSLAYLVCRLLLEKKKKNKTLTRVHDSELTKHAGVRSEQLVNRVACVE